MPNDMKIIGSISTIIILSQTAKTLDREQQEEHLLLIKATEDCITVPANESFFDAADDTLLKVIVNVTDINDNPPKFVSKVFTGGVTTAADFGAQVMNVKVIILFLFQNNTLTRVVLSCLMVTRYFAGYRSGRREKCSSELLSSR